LLGVLLAHWLLNGARYSRTDVFDAPAVRPAQLAAWLIGFAVYQWLLPTGPGWWVDAVESVRPSTGGLDAIGVSIPSFVAAFALAAAAGGFSRRARPSRT
jgi:hypothetical protein